jgi:hypothetical protein
LKRRLINFGDVAQQGIDEIASKNRANLRDLTRRPEPIEARSKGLLQSRRDGLNSALLATFNKQARHLFNEQRHAAGALADPFDNLLRKNVLRGDLADHASNLSTVEWRKRNDCMM